MFGTHIRTIIHLGGYLYTEQILYHVWYSFTYYLCNLFDTHLQNNYISFLQIIYRTIISHVWFSFTEQLYIMFGTHLQNNYN